MRIDTEHVRVFQIGLAFQMILCQVTAFICRYLHKINNTGNVHITLDRKFCGNVAVGRITVVEFEQHLKWTLPQNLRSNVTYVIPVTLNCSYCTPDDGRGECPKHVEWSCNKTKILLLHLVGYLFSHVENDAWINEPKIYL
jgi:hypothetical protein